MRTWRHHPRAEERHGAAIRWLRDRVPGEECVVLVPGLDAGNALLRDALGDARASFGWHRFTLAQLAQVLAGPSLASAGLTPAAPLVLEAACARVVFELAALGAPNPLGRLLPVAQRPGLPRALAATLRELASAEVQAEDVAAVAPELGAVSEAYQDALGRFGLCRRADVFRAARERVAQSDHPLLGMPILCLDVPLRSRTEGRLLGALTEASNDALVLLPTDDERTLRFVPDRSSVAVLPAPPPPDNALGRLSTHLFGGAPAAHEGDVSLTLREAPGEHREAVEIARSVLAHAASGVPLDRIAIVLRSPELYRAPITEAFERAGVPVHFTKGAARPDPAGRALLALLDCASEQLSARAFAEYLSLGVLPERDEGAPPAAKPLEETAISPDYELLAYLAYAEPDEDELGEEEPYGVDADGDGDDDDDEDAVDGGRTRAGVAPTQPLRAPRRWERLLVDAAVIGGRDRWARRIAGLRAELGAALEAARNEGEEERVLRLERRLAELDELRDFALPIIDDLAALPSDASSGEGWAWGPWLDALMSLATRAIQKPDAVLRVLQELRPMAPVGPVSLGEVRVVLQDRLGTLQRAPTLATGGAVLALSTDEVRGRSFRVVFAPGLAEKIFPKKVLEDPILLDEGREQLSPDLDTRKERGEDERTALRLLVGAASERLEVSWPSVDAGRARPRVPSFYGLEIIRASEGRLPGFGELSRRAERGVAMRLGWPAPEDPADAIDEAEYDLARLARLLGAAGSGAAEREGAAHYLLQQNEHLARSLRARARRWASRRFARADGMIDPREAAAEALRTHRLAERPYSATALQQFARCPYAFFLRNMAKLAPREEPAPLEAIDPLSRGRLIHDAQFRALRAMRSEGLFPLGDEARLARARVLLDQELDHVIEIQRELLAPAIEHVFRASCEEIRVDLQEWLGRMAARAGDGWVPTHFELAFGLGAHSSGAARDQDSQPEPLEIRPVADGPAALSLRGAIDMVQQRQGVLRAVDHKTGRAHSGGALRLGGGQTLQPVLYALALEARFGPDREVIGGSLSYCTRRGGFAETFVPLDDEAREGVAVLSDAIDGAIRDGFLAPLPVQMGRAPACDYCDYQPVCGPHEARRTRRKVASRSKAGPQARDTYELHVDALRGLRRRR